jgi:peptidoglycan/xylan/chitin deacetylase (PgdA/CDA1 family)
MALKSIIGVLSPSGPQARLSILIFHRVLSRPDLMFPGEQDGRRFDEVLAWVARWFQVIPLDEGISRLGTGSLPARAAAITFDDGYADNATQALPILQRHGMTATFFVATSFLDGGRMWNDSVIEAVRACSSKVLDLTDGGLGIYQLDSFDSRRKAVEALLGKIKYLEPAKREQAVAYVQQSVGKVLPDELMMKSKQVLQLRQAGMQIGAHTCSHPILASLPDAEAFDEIKGSKSALESLLGEPVRLFAYPNGKPGKDYLAKHAHMVRRAGFMAAVSTAPGVSTGATDPFQLPRFSPWDTGRLRYGMRMIANLRSVQTEVT